MTRPDTLSLPEISAMLAQQAGAVADRYAPPAQGSYTLGGQYFTLNPGRPDKRVGSFMVNVSGPMVGRWKDFSTGEGGDLIDLIRLSLSCDARGAILEARAYLGLTVASPEVTAQRKRAAAAAIERQKQRAADAEAMAEKARRAAHALWLGARPMEGTPVQRYLEARGIDLSRLDRMPGALRYLPDAWYQHEDADTGEVIETRLPAMVATAVNRRGKTVACHRTYLALRGGVWCKADVPAPKKVMGSYRAAAIRVWSGAVIDGKRPKRLAEVAPGARVFLTEGIEDALSCAVLMPEERVLAAISLSNIRNVDLPPAVTRVTIVGDRDEGPQAREVLDRAVEAHARAGREVRLWQNMHGGKDLNDALRGTG